MSVELPGNGGIWDEVRNYRDPIDGEYYVLYKQVSHHAKKSLYETFRETHKAVSLTIGSECIACFLCDHIEVLERKVEQLEAQQERDGLSLRVARNMLEAIERACMYDNDGISSRPLSTVILEELKK